MMRYRWDRTAGRIVEVRDAPPGMTPQGPMIRSDLAGYRSPVTGLWVEGRRARREDLARSGCREVDPSERPGASLAPSRSQAGGRA